MNVGLVALATALKLFVVAVAALSTLMKFMSSPPDGIDPLHIFDEWVDISAEIIGYAPGSEEMENLGKDDETIVVIS